MGKEECPYYIIDIINADAMSIACYYVVIVNLKFAGQHSCEVIIMVDMHVSMASLVLWKYSWHSCWCEVWA